MVFLQTTLLFLNKRGKVSSNSEHRNLANFTILGNLSVRMDLQY